MGGHAAEENIRASLAKLADLNEEMRERAYRSVDAYVQYMVIPPEIRGSQK